AHGLPTGRRALRARRRCFIHLEHVDILSETAIKSGECSKVDDYNTTAGLCVLHYNAVCMKAAPSPCRRAAAMRDPGHALACPAFFSIDPNSH
ncbi:hypothetical protein SB861_59965, partial [Paraburkholderia sp. SIMBA_049]